LVTSTEHEVPTQIWEITPVDGTNIFYKLATDLSWNNGYVWSFAIPAGSNN
jgi:hypothetical protein